ACVEIVVHGCDHRTPVRTRSVTWDELPVVVTFAPTGTQVTRADNPREGMWWRVSGAHIRSAARNSRRPADSVGFPSSGGLLGLVVASRARLTARAFTAGRAGWAGHHGRAGAWSAAGAGAAGRGVRGWRAGRADVRRA